MNYGVFAPKNFDFQEGKELSLPGKFAPGNFWNFSSCEQKWNFHFLELAQYAACQLGQLRFACLWCAKSSTSLKVEMSPLLGDR